MTALAPRQSAELSTDRHDPRDDWPDEARALADHLAAIYGDRDALPAIAGGWIARQKSRHTRRAYVRTFKAWEEYARSTGIHPLQAKLPLADAYAKHLAKTPTRNGRPPAETTQAQALAAAGRFYTYAARLQAVDSDPFAAVNRPYVDPDYSPTEGMTEDETTARIKAADDQPDPKDLETWDRAQREAAILEGPVKLAASPLADRPGYRKEWRP